MTHGEQRLWLIQQLLNERNDAAGVQIPEDEQGQKDLLRGLMNIRMPDPIDAEFLRIQDEYLTEENLAEGVVKIEDLTPVKADNRLYIWQGDMSRLAVDAVTLPANSGFTGCYQYLHNCLDNILGSKAGIELRLFTNSIITKQGYPEPTGQAKIRLTKENERLLASCYRSILELADQNDIKTLALCCISTGVFMFPNQRAAEIAVETVRKYLEETGSQIKVIFNVFKDIDLMFYKYYLGEPEAE